MKQEGTEKVNCAIRDFDILLQEGNIAFYKGCEVIQIFIYDKVKKTAVNFYTLFTFDEIDKVSEESVFLSDKLQSLNDNYSFGVIQKRLSIENAKQEFQNVQKGCLNFDETCEVSKSLALLPKAYIRSISNSFINDVLVNDVIKPSFWGDNYIIEYFDEKKAFFPKNAENSNRLLFDKITSYVKTIPNIKIDLEKVYDRIGNIIFQFPITLYKTEFDSKKNQVDFSINMKPHPLLQKGKNLQISMQSTLDNVITGFDSFTTNELEINHVFHVGNDNTLKTIVYDLDTNLILYQSEIILTKAVCCFEYTGMYNSEPRTIIHINTEKTEFIEIHHKETFGIGHTEKDYESIISDRNLNNKILKHSNDYFVSKENDRDEALIFLKEKFKKNDIKEVCLWNPYLRAADIIELLYFENTGIPFRCITSYQKSKDSETKSFNEFVKKENDYFESHSNNLSVKMKFLAQHEDYGWKFHDRFLILVPTDDEKIPDVYSLGTSVNSLGMHHHIIQKITNPRIILHNFDELWKILDNTDCLITEFPKRYENE